ncbi:hypothetical protein [Cohaesibacter marisflavi]|uniref:hypothetical protein n=1 Tax=Cohaesibacter marisflavi TaxID=655353 RepID=UPI0029C939AD|nr:hypothetical protein [Cohaesibacter marisflavi]
MTETHASQTDGLLTGPKAAITVLPDQEQNNEAADIGWSFPNDVSQIISVIIFLTPKTSEIDLVGLKQQGRHSGA